MAIHKDSDLIDGHDKFGDFRLGGGHCDVCNVVGVVINYPDLHLPEWHGAPMPADATIIKAEDRAVGVTCGCYARWHRQVAHMTGRAAS